MKVSGTDSSIQNLPELRTDRSQESARARGTEAAAGLRPSSAEEGSSSVQLSDSVSDVDRIRELAKASPEIRAEVVAQAQADLSAGTLTADPAALAQRIAQDLLG